MDEKPSSLTVTNSTISAYKRRSSMGRLGAKIEKKIGKNAPNLVNAPGEGDLGKKTSEMKTRFKTGWKGRFFWRKDKMENMRNEMRQRLTRIKLDFGNIKFPMYVPDFESKPRKDAKFHAYIKKLTESTLFNGFIMLIIFLNTIILALETIQTLMDKYRLLFICIDQTFLAIYTIEAAMKIYAEPINYWKQFSNLFDFVLVIVSLFQPVIELFVQGAGGVMVFRMFRALKALRTLRSVSFSKNLQVLVTALLDTLKNYVFSVIMLLLFIMFIFAIIGFYLFGSNAYDSNVAAKKEWGTLGLAMLSLFTFVTVDGWTNLQDNIDNADTTGKFSRIFTICFICIGHFLMTNVFIGIIIMNISEATETYRREKRHEKEVAVQNKKKFMMKRQREDVNQMAARQKQGDWKDFFEMVRSYQNSLRHDDYITMTDISSNPVWIDTFLNTLDQQDITLQYLKWFHYEAFHNLAMSLEEKLEEDATEMKLTVIENMMPEKKEESGEEEEEKIEESEDY